MSGCTGAWPLHLGDGEHSVLLVQDTNELDLSVAAERVDDKMESVSYDAITTIDTSVRWHFPEDVRDFSQPFKLAPGGHIAGAASSCLHRC